MRPSHLNPYAAPKTSPGEHFHALPQRRNPFWLCYAFVLALLYYAGITMLLLTSTREDRFYGYFFVPVLLLLTWQTLGVWRSQLRSPWGSFLVVSAQIALSIWLCLEHGVNTATCFFAMLPMLVIIGLCLMAVSYRNTALSSKTQLSPETH